jgi:adenylate cyclase class 2
MSEGSSPLLRNIELKARCRDLSAAAAALRPLDVKDGGAMEQIDTYFSAPKGRLKLREIVGVRAELIWYNRADEAHIRNSDYWLVPVPDAQKLKTALTSALGARRRIRKRRQVYLWHNVRIHLDEVDELGKFVEFEAVMSAGEDEATAHARLGELCRVLSISPADHIAGSYVDLE